MLTKQLHTMPMVGIEKKIAFLSKISAYPEDTEKVEIIETHHSWIFLTDSLVYKLKKPIKNGLHDYSSLEARRNNSLEELCLNRRLAPKTYLEVVPLGIDRNGQFLLEEEGAQIIDWLVKMKRLPTEHMLDAVIKNESVREEDIDKTATKLARFFKNASAEKISFEDYYLHLAEAIKDARLALLNPEFKLEEKRINEIASALLSFLENKIVLLKHRITSGFIKEGHGDLRPEHICLQPEPVIFDCLEFNRLLRIKDPIDELAYLSLECDILDAPEVGERFLAIYGQINDDEAPQNLVHFYKALRAFIRAQLAMEHWLEEQYRSEIKWQRKAQRYLQEAVKAIAT